VVAGKYRVESSIGAGGMGVVLGATDTTLGRPVAIKVLAPAKAAREDAVQRFLREARAAASIQSEHVVRVFEVDTTPTTGPFIVMEHLRGADLAHTLAARGALPFDEAVDCVLQACEALAEAHGRGIVHRDLKPQNLFLTQRPDGSPCLKVLDFGISKAVDEQAPNLTSTDTVMGTPLYMSPEQVRSLKNVDSRSDIWALGSILFELVTVSPIFQAPSATALCAMIAMDPPIPLRAKRPDAPPELEAIILRCLHKDPAGRFQDVAQLAHALAPYASERGRAYVDRIARVVAGAPAPLVSGSSAPGALPYAPTSTGTTADGLSATPLSYPAATAPPLAHAPTTQSTWQHTGDVPRKSGGSSALLAVLGVVTGLVVVGIVVSGVGYFFYKKKIDEAAIASATAEAGTPAAAAAAPTTSASAAPPTSSTAVAAAPPPSGKKAGAAPSATVAAKDAGASKANDDFEAKKRQHTVFCSHNQFLLSQPNVSDSTLRQVQTSQCLPGNSPDGSRCERQNCRQACAALKDQGCLQQVNFADQSFPAKY
jgi:serine/threonine-protein kinase